LDLRVEVVLEEYPGLAGFLQSVTPARQAPAKPAKKVAA